VDPKQTVQDEEIIQELDFLLSLDVLQEAEELEIDLQDSEAEEEM
jgi:hypothetical protein